MADNLTLEQQRALARARARLRLQQTQQEVPSAGPPPPQPRAAPQPQLPSLATRGPVGRFFQGMRPDVRAAVQQRKPIDQLVIESAPSLIGAGLGGAAGSVLGPPGIIVGASIGGGLGEYLGQSSGVSPESNTMLGVTTAAPLAGGAAVKGVQMVGRTGGNLLKRIPAVRAARAINKERTVLPEIRTTGGQTLNRQTGILARPSGDIYAAIERSGVKYPTARFGRTLRATTKIINELTPVADFKEAKAAIGIAKSLEQSLQGSDPVPLTTIVKSQQMIGSLVGKLEKQSGAKFGAAKHAFSELADDLDQIAQAGGREGRGAMLAKTAATRFKMEMAAKSWQKAVSEATYDVPGRDEIAVSIKTLRAWLRQVSDPHHGAYDKNFVTGMGDTLDTLKDNLAKISEITDVSRSAAGAGSIVVRGITAGTAGAIGQMVLGGPGLAGGALLGATAPEDLLRLLTSPRGAKMLERALQRGRGTIDARAIGMISQAVAQYAARPWHIKAPPEQKARGIPFSQTSSMLNRPDGLLGGQ